MKFLKIALLISPILMLFPKLANAQMMTLDPETSMLLQEFSVVLTYQSEEISVQMSLSNNASSENDGDQLERGDVIIMMNGKRLNDMASLKSTFETIEEGDEIKIGVQRGDERFILSATKGDIPETGGRMMMTTESASNGSVHGPVVVAEIGAVLSDEDGVVSIAQSIPQLQPDAIKEANIDGFTILSINGEEISEAKKVQEILTEIEVGEEVSITFSKDGEEKRVTFTKEAPRGNIRMSVGN